MKNSKGENPPDLPDRKNQRKSSRIVWYQYLDAKRKLHYYYEPKSQQTVWEVPTGVTIKDGKTNKTLTRSDSSKKKHTSGTEASTTSSSNHKTTTSLSNTTANVDVSNPLQSATLTTAATATATTNITTSPSKTNTPSPSTSSHSVTASVPKQRKTWRRALCGEQDGLREYFYVPETGECSWSLPSTAWEHDDVKCYPTTQTKMNTSITNTNTANASAAAAQRSPDMQLMHAFLRPRIVLSSPSSSSFVDSKTGSNDQQNQKDSKKKEVQWIVKLHLSSGQMYYLNKTTGNVQWNDPYDVIDTKEEELAQEKQEIESSVRLLVGNKYLKLKNGSHNGSHNGLQNGSNLTQIEAIIQQSIQSHQIAFNGSYADAMIRFPEYIDPCSTNSNNNTKSWKSLNVPGVRKITFQVSDKVRIRVYSPSNQANSHTQFFTIVPSAESTIEEVTKMAISKCASAALRRNSINGNKNGHEIFEKNVNCYVLKAVGEHSYLVHLNYPLIWYDHVQQKLRESDGKLKESAVIELHLVRVTKKEMVYLNQIRNKIRIDITECTDEEQYIVKKVTYEKCQQTWNYWFDTNRTNKVKDAKNATTSNELKDEQDKRTRVVHDVIDTIGLVLGRRYSTIILHIINNYDQTFQNQNNDTQKETKETKETKNNTPLISTSSTVHTRGPLEKHSVGLVDWDALNKSCIIWEQQSEQEKDKDQKDDQGEKETKSNQHSSQSQHGTIPLFQDPRVHRFKNASWINKMKWPLRINMKGLSNVSRRWVIQSEKNKEERRLHIVTADVFIGLYNNNVLLKKNGNGGTGITGSDLSNVTSRIQINQNNIVHWNGNETCIEFNGIQLCELPITTRLGFTLRGYTQDGKSENLACGSITLMTEKGCLRQGIQDIHFWKYHQIDRCPMNPGSVIPCTSIHDSECQLTFEFDRFPTPIVASPLKPMNILVFNTSIPSKKNTKCIDTSNIIPGTTTLQAEALVLPSRAHANMTGMIETPAEALIDATIRSHKNVIAFQCAQKVNVLHPKLSLSEKKIKMISYLPPLSKTLSIEQNNIVEAELNWCTNDDVMLESISHLTPLDDAILLGNAMLQGGSTPRVFLWRHRYHVASTSQILSKFLKIINWGNHEMVREGRELMSRWNIERPEQCLELLGSSYSDPIVRAYAVLQLSKMKDLDLAGYLLQLVQCLKTELYDDSPLLRFMLRRSLRNPIVVGHKLFWLLRSELHNNESLGRYGLLLELYVINCGSHRVPLKGIHTTVASLERVTKYICDLGKKDKKDRNNIAREQLSQIVWPTKFGTCLTSLHMCSGIILDKCKVMDSKQAPLWIEFQNADLQGDNIKVMFKVGDDLRQDQMTLQFLDILDRKSLATGKDICFRPYRVAGTGHEVGMVEMVPHSDTIARMQWAGGGPYDKKPLFDNILANAKMKETAVEDALNAFTRSCGGYVVATYVMGIGDRHPSNIMMQEDGHLFHIDFGHFLGNFKVKKILGTKIARERSPLVFTPQMLHVLNPTGDKLHGKEVDAFLEVCYSTYALLRERASEFITLFTLMVTAGLPELKKVSDVMYMQDKLHLRSTSKDGKKNTSSRIAAKEANKLLHSQLKSALKTTSKQLDDWMHMQKHKEDAEDGNRALFEFYDEMRRVKKTAPLYWYKKKRG